MRVVEVLEKENKEDEDDSGEGPGDALHHSGTGGRVEDVCQQSWRKVNFRYKLRGQND